MEGTRQIEVPDSLTDGVVTLRPWGHDDVPALVAACQDGEIPRWTNVPYPYDERAARDFLASSAGEMQEGRAVHFAVVDPETDAVRGSIAIMRLDQVDSRGEVGYWIAATARGQGLATRALELLSAWAFETLALARLELLTQPRNEPSQRVAEHAGYQREGLLRSYREQKGERVDLLMYSRLAPGE